MVPQVKIRLAKRKRNDSARKVSKATVGRTESNLLVSRERQANAGGSIEFIKTAFKNIKCLMSLRYVLYFISYCI